jgi:hypothetical protein
MFKPKHTILFIQVVREKEKKKKGKKGNQLGKQTISEKSAKNSSLIEKWLISQSTKSLRYGFEVNVRPNSIYLEISTNKKYNRPNTKAMNTILNV